MIGIAILNWNGKKLLNKFLPSIIKYSKEAKIYVIDNNSSDGSQYFIKANFPTVKLIINDKNYGYAKGYNIGLKLINEEVLCLLNNDVMVQKDWLKPIIKSFNKNESISIAQPLIIDYNNKDYFNYSGAAGGFIDKYGYPFCRGRIFNSIEVNKNQYNDLYKIFWASGTCLFIRKKVFNKLKGFDSDFFMHQEEIDLCWRAYNMGYQTYNVGETKVYHLGEASLPSGPKKVFYNFRNSILMLIKNLPSSNFIEVIISRIIMDFLAFIRFFITGQIFKAVMIIRAYFSALKFILKKIRQRKNMNYKKFYYFKKSIIFDYFILKKVKF
ncbi:MAG: glycosyltransferase family 2 protein [Flavobacteriaceae bacterium]|nr:glycosyltransferase family 2 protein [Flavobacteriaceae bacterium]